MEIKMQEQETLRTVECLRGRLLAERAASRAAKETAELMDAKLKDLEKQLKIETKLRKKAEKRLILLKKKIESLNIPLNIVSEESEQSSSSDHSGESCISSIASNTSTNQQEECFPKSDVSRPRFATGETTDRNHDSLKTSTLDKINHEDEDTDTDNVDNSMALVLVDSPIDTTGSCNGVTQVSDETVREVLNTLKQIKENIQSTLNTRRVATR